MLYVPKIRVAQPNDAEAILGFIRSCAMRFGVIAWKNNMGVEENQPAVSFIKTDGAVLRLQSQLGSERPPFRCSIAEHTTQGPVGFALYYPAFSDWSHSAYPWIEDLYSKSIYDVGDCRIIEKALMRGTVSEAWKEGCPRIETRSLITHQESRVFYREFDMYITSELKTYRLDVPTTIRAATGNVRIRQAGRGDLRDISTYIQKSADFQGLGYKVNRKRVVEKLEFAFDRNFFECLIAERNGVPVGFAIYYQAYSSWEQCPYMVIEDLHTFFPRKGVGKALFVRLGEIAEKRNYSRIETRIRQTTRSAVNAAVFVEAMGMHRVVVPPWRTFRLDLTAATLNKLEIYDLTAQQ
ncbi:MAG: putative spermidine/spermine N-acetyltransferase [Parcubacteria group bacterium Gr01-1014_48]|nr:MAG: putative spermidine/spermine N-acetyltransferase [Parcubacteria group bacterium Greene0416_14]TSC74540.1 MAG: putative spermidine/spermine N-acetyltransferase [Parcubacteria group bacterium Gr01-1014_48]TSD01416.1 MAG: putative spermidine/spermine N-acetyltransferase [Parcubacteria group bacterium Greene1014_15]TSD08442.1 MAG: putative spermidine/spermine N-acetyltransferase [Parcubacteria group bacterium Greene0714_4]